MLVEVVALGRPPMVAAAGCKGRFPTPGSPGPGRRGGRSAILASGRRAVVEVNEFLVTDKKIPDVHISTFLGPRRLSVRFRGPARTKTKLLMGMKWTTKGPFGRGVRVGSRNRWAGRRKVVERTDGLTAAASMDVRRLSIRWEWWERWHEEVSCS